jgi:hypothetical protein
MCRLPRWATRSRTGWAAPESATARTSSTHLVAPRACYAPLVAGSRAIIKHVDDFRPVHDLASLADLARPHRPTPRGGPRGVAAHGAGERIAGAHLRAVEMMAEPRISACPDNLTRRGPFPFAHFRLIDRACWARRRTRFPLAIKRRNHSRQSHPRRPILVTSLLASNPEHHLCLLLKMSYEN